MLKPFPKVIMYNISVNIIVESKTRPYHGRVGTGRRTAGRHWWGGDGQDGTPTGRSPRRQTSLFPSRQWRTTLLGVSLEARTSEIVCKPMEEHNGQLTRGLSVVYPRDLGRSSFLVADQCADAYLSL